MLGWFHRLKVVHKLTLISVSFMIPDAVLLCLFLNSVGGDIEFARLERQGIEYQRALQPLLEHVPQHYLLARRGLAGDEQSAERLADAEARIDRDLEKLAAVDVRLGSTLQFTRERLAETDREHCLVQNVAQQWQDLKDQLRSADPEAGRERHRRLVATVRAMIAHAGDTSNLILDPDLDSYYVMDVTLLGLPQMQERLAAVMAYGEATLQQPAPTGKQRTELSVYAAMLKEADLDRILASARTALAEDRRFYGTRETLQQRLPPALKRFEAEAAAFIDLTRGLANGETGGVSRDAFLAAGVGARQASFQLWEVANRELDGLLQARIDRFTNRRANSLVLSALALLAAVSLVAFITRSISGPLQRQAAELRSVNRALQASESGTRLALAETELVLKSISSALICLDATGVVDKWNAAAEALFGVAAGDVLGRNWRDCRLPSKNPNLTRRIEQLVCARRGERLENVVVLPADGDERVLSIKVNPIWDGHSFAGMLLLADDRTQAVKLELNLRQAQKLESVGRLAAGMAHEINTPMQYVADNTRFLRGAFEDLTGILDQCARLTCAVESDQPVESLLKELDASLARADMAFLNEEITSSLDQSLEGINRVQTIVRTMKEFAHPGGAGRTLVSLNDAVSTTVKVARSEWKPVADVELELDPACPQLLCVLGELNQALLNLIVNAAQAIADVVHDGANGKGVIRIATGSDGETAEIRISDTGGGIPAEVRSRIFDPFFTTKEVGKGTGQGLAIARSVIVERHGGSIDVETEVGRGTTFVLRLPTGTASRPSNRSYGLRSVAPSIATGV